MCYCSGSMTEDYCGVEPITHPPPPVETRPQQSYDQDKIDSFSNETNSALIGGK